MPDCKSASVKPSVYWQCSKSLKAFQLPPHSSPTLSAIFPHLVNNAISFHGICPLTSSAKSKPAIETKLCDGDYLYLRMCQDNTPYFTFEIRLKTNTRIKNSWCSIGEYPTVSLATARNKARGMRTLVARGINPVDYSSDVAKLGKTFGEITELFTDQYFPTVKIRSIEKWHSTMRRTYVLNNVVMEKITEADIQDIMHKADKDGTKSIAAGILQRMKMLFKWAKREGYVPHNPTLEMERSYKIGVRERYLQPNELKYFLNNMGIVALPQAAIYSLLVLLTRKEELLRLKWQDVDLAKLKKTATIKAEGMVA